MAIQEGIKYQETVTFITEVCCNCGIPFGMPSNLVRILKSDPNKSFYCPNGHGQHYSKSATQIALDKAKDDLIKAQNSLAQAKSSNAQLEDLLRKERDRAKRVKNGTCPCCKRHFKALAAHMKNKHPHFTQSEDKSTG